MVRWLLDRGAALTRVDSSSRGAARAAIAGGAIEVLALVHERGITWKGALREVVLQDDDRALRWLLANVEFDDDEKRSAAWHCAAHDRVTTLQTLLAHGIQDNDMPATAALYGSEGVLAFLLSRGADPHATYRGKTLLDLALEGADSDQEYAFDEEDLEEPLARRLLALGVTSKWLPNRG